MTNAYEFVAWGPLHAVDGARRWLGRQLDFWWHPPETPYRVALDAPGVRLRAYSPADAAGPVILLIPAPIKSPRIWDLTASRSVVRACMRAGLRTYLLEWAEPQNKVGPPALAAGERIPSPALRTPAEPPRLRSGLAVPSLAPRGLTEGGLDDYADRLPLACVQVVQREAGKRPVFIAGHSLGGTLAAIFASLHPEVVAGLILIEAPVDFGPGSGPFGLLARAAPRLARPTGDVPGAALDLLAYTASPVSIVWLRHLDQLASLADPQALRTHALVERWSLDEMAMPRRLFEDVAERLCRRNLFMTGGLQVSGRPADPARIAAPLLLVVERWSDVAPPASAEPLLAAAPHPRNRVLVYSGDTGVALQHVGPLVGAHAHAELWPEIFAWIGAS